ncbi:MAG: stomatin-like protein [Prochlorothrix sp.]|nr:stomatin-like protein [Prochlorothrix sp.]
MDAFLAPALATLLAVVGYVSGSVKIVNQGDVALVERLGRYRRTLQPGLNFTLPMVDSIIVDTAREQVLDVPAQEAITADNVPIKVDGLVYWKIVDLYLVHYGVDDVKLAVESTVLTTLRNEVGKRSLQDLLTARDEINDALLKELDESTENWGVKVTRVELKDIILPDDVRASMAKAKAAENERAAAMEVAEGLREAAEEEAKGRKEAAKMEAEGIASAIETIMNTLRAQGVEHPEQDSQVFQRVIKYLVAQRYMDASEKIGESTNAKILFMDPQDLHQAMEDFIETPSNTIPGRGKAKA